MALRTPEEYRRGLQDGRVVYIMGQRVDDVVNEPHLKVGVETAALDFEFHTDPSNRELAVLEDERFGEPVSRYFEVPEQREAVRRRFDLISASSRHADAALPFIKDVGTDLLNGLLAVARGMGNETYVKRLEAYRRHCATNDLSLSGGVTDVKGDRSKSPSEQDHPDYYLRVVDETDDAIVVSGAKAHITASAYCDEIIVIPTRNLTADEADYAVAFAVPLDTPGITQVCRPAFRYEDPAHFPTPRPRRGHVEALVIFDNVRVPKERVFQLREWQVAQFTAYTFSAFHRFTAVTYKIPILEYLTGLAILAAEANGVKKASHVRELLLSMATYTETTRALASAAVAEAQELGGTGLWVANPLVANMAKLHFAQGFHDFVRNAQDIAGGLLVTQPTYKDWQQEELRPYLERYLGGAGEYDAEQRLKLMSTLHHVFASDFAGWHEVCTIHAEGSIAAQKMMLSAEAPWSEYKERARELVGLGAPAEPQSLIGAAEAG